MEETYAIEYRKGTKWNENPGHSYKYMECKVCGQFAKASEDTSSVTCYECVQEMTEPPEINTNKNSGRPSGWHFMKEFVDKRGNVYHRGVEQPQLKGKLKPTELVKKKKLSKKEKEEYKRLAAVEVSIIKKEMKKLRWKKDKKLAMQKIKNYNRILKGKFTESLVTKLFN